MFKCISYQSLWSAAAWTASYISVLFCCRHHCHLPLGGLQSPGAAWAGSVWHHLSLPASPCNPLRITGYVHALQTICLRLHLLALKWNFIPKKLTTCNKHKNWKKRKNNLQKKQQLSVVFRRILLLTLQLTHNICSCLGSLHLSLTSPIDLHCYSKRHFLSSRFSPLLLFSILLTDKTWNKQGSLKLSLSDKPVKWVGSHFMCFGASFTISGACPSTPNILNTKSWIL